MSSSNLSLMVLDNLISDGSALLIEFDDFSKFLEMGVGFKTEYACSMLLQR